MGTSANNESGMLRMREGKWRDVMGPEAMYAWDTIQLGPGGWRELGNAVTMPAGQSGRLIWAINIAEEIWEWPIKRTTCDPGYYYSIRRLPLKYNVANASSWSAVPPQQEGWFWRLDTGCCDIVRVRREHAYGDQLCCLHGADFWPVEKSINALWRGPILEPSRP